MRVGFSARTARCASLGVLAALALGGCAAHLGQTPATDDGRRRAMEYFVKAKVYESQGNNLGAIVALRSAADLDPTSPTIYSQLAYNYERIRDLGMAAIFARRALELDPQRLDLRYRLVRWLDVAGEEAQAAVELEKLIQYQPAEWPLYSHLAHLYLEIGHQERIRPLFERLLARPDTPVEARVNAAHILARSGDRDRAETVFNQVLLVQPDLEDAWIGLSEVQLARGDRQAAIETLRRAGRALPESSLAMYELAGMVATADELSEILAGEDARFTYRLGVSLSEQERYDLAAQAFERIVRLRPQSVEGWLDAARYYLHVANYDRLDEVMGEAVEAFPDSIDLYLFWAGALERGERFAAADSIYARAVARRGVEDIYLYWGFGLERRQEWDRAIEVYRQGLGAVGPSAQLYVRWGLSLARQGRWSDAASRFRRAAEVDSLSSDAHLHWGVALQRLQRWDEAVTQLTVAARLDTEGTFSLFSLGSCQEQMARERGDEVLFERAVATFERVLELDPGDAFALNYLGYMFAERGIELERAAQLLQRALAIDPDNAAFLDSMGWTYYRLGDLIQAEHYLSRALGRVASPAPAAEAAEGEGPGAMDDGELAVLHEHAGDIARALGKEAEALAHWRRSLELRPASDEVRSKLRELEGRPGADRQP
ncbi:MAG: tetratricopeptide repeat protein [Gemmatimonadota bacterium]